MLTDFDTSNKFNETEEALKFLDGDAISPLEQVISNYLQNHT